MPALRGRHLLVVDALATVAAFVISLALRFEPPAPLFDAYLNQYAWVIPLLLVCRISAFVTLRLYTRVWRYASVGELIAVLAAVGGSSLVAYFIVYLAVTQSPANSLGFPRSVAVMDTVLMTAMAGAWRFALRIVGVGRAGPRSTNGGERALVVGGGSAALAVLREIASNRDLGLRPVGVIADDIAPGQRLMGVPTLGGIGSLVAIIKRQSVAVVLLALPSADGRTIRHLVREAEATGARCLTVPSVAEVVAGRVTVNALREVEVEDLLRRAPSRIDLAEVSGALQGRCVLITGAGGSIGSELARQVLRFGARRLILLGRGENSIFEVVESLRRLKGDCDLTPVIQDVRDRAGLFRTFYETRPDVVFHAAAHKHVTLMEQYPEEAVTVNVYGTANVLDAAVASEVRRVVVISTDKAVNPSSVMGVTKRIGELLVNRVALEHGVDYVSVRFGNVLSSRGSVVPLFRKQLANGEPITITHRDATRYFMTIPEAVQLVLQAGVLPGRGDTFVLDMGAPVSIMDLARDLVELHGLELGKDVQVEFIGNRPGEKLTEELYFAHESARLTPHDAIRRVEWSLPPSDDLRSAIQHLVSAAERHDRPAIIRSLRDIVPEYERRLDILSRATFSSQRA